MPKVKVEENKHNPLFDAIRRIELENPEIVNQDDRYKIVDIMEFCNGKQYLDIPGNGLKLFPGQSVILKAFYKGTTGNEDIKLDQEEWEWLYARQEDIEIDGVTYERNLRDVIKKIHEKEKDETYKPFTQLVLVLGRRGTKCHEENQIISTTEGSITFRELMERKLDGEKIGICTYDPLTLKRSITYDIQLEENGVVECFSLETKRGIREVASWNHPYLVWRDNWDKPQFVKMSELMEGDRIAVAECTELFGKGGNCGDIDLNCDFDHIPECIYRGSRKEVFDFLSKNYNWNLDRGEFVCRSASEDFIYGVRHLLQKFGIHAEINKINCAYFESVISDPYYIDKFLIEGGAIDELESEFLNVYKPDLKWDIVKSVSEVGERSTIAIEVKGTNIIGGDIISHNTFMASIITAYEAYKLILINNGDPHRYYNLPNDDEIAIINVALSQKQAGRLFGQVQSRLRNSPFFKGRIAKETSDTIRLYTDRDLQKKSEGAILSIQGSILLLCGHSNPDSLAGYSAILLLFDEIAFYDETGKVTGKYFVNRLKPSLSKFYKYNAGKVVMISSPNVKNGAFYDAFMEATDSDEKISDTCLSFQLPTWDINLDVSYSEPELAKERNANPEMFKIEFGGQWAEGGSYTNYFDAGAVDRCIKYELGPHQRPNPRCNYYIHVDPAKKSNNYAAIMVAKERYTTPLGKKRNKCSLAGIWVWKPTPGLGLLFDEIDNYIIQICSRFHPMSVTYDDYHSVHSVQRLRGHGINCTQISFNDRVKCKVYQNLNNMMLYQPEPEILLYDNCPETTLLIAELKELKIKRTKRGYSIMPDKHGDIASDDLSDCLAGACSAANEGLRMALPGPVTVRLGSHW
jgi:hypothetical protein